MMLHHRDQKALEATLDELRRALGDRLAAVSLRGEAAGEGYIARKSPLELVVVVDRVDGAVLQRLRPFGASWRRRRIAPPLVLDPAYIEASLDTFPLEFLDLRERRIQLAGAVDPFVDLVINREHLRLELEEQLRGKLLHLWAAYAAHTRRARALRAFLYTVVAAYEPLLRALLYLAERPRPSLAAGALRAVESTFDIELPTLCRLDAARHGDGRIGGAALDAAFDGCLAEARSLVSTVDGL